MGVISVPAGSSAGASARPAPASGTSTAGSGSRTTSTDWTQCLKAQNHSPGEFCGDSSSFAVTLTNTCSTTIEAQLCFKRQNGTANCGRESNLAPGASQEFWGCELTGDYEYLGCEHWRTRKGSCSMMDHNALYID